MSNPNIQRFGVGDVAVTKVVDLVEAMSPKVLYVDRTRDDFNPYLDWLQPHFLNEDRLMLLSIHSFIVRTSHHTVLVDTCIGNHKAHAGFPQWEGREGRYLEDLKAAGLSPEDIDFVFCTHMHIDHTGWNTRLADGRWVPTFPNATYLFNKSEYENWRQSESEFDQWVLKQNIEPIIEAGQVRWVDNDWGIDDQLSLLPTPGHTPGHCSVQLKSGGSQAVITGDMLIHPVQIADPTWRQKADHDKAQAIETRTKFVESVCDRDLLVLGTHFHTPTGVRVVDTPEGRRLRF